MENSSISWSKSGWAAAEALPPEFYARHTVDVARALLGKVLIVDSGSGRRKGITVGRIVETEAYRAGDPASHSASGRTKRTSVMFGQPGRVYVYFIYGMYEMLNFVTEPEGAPGAVLIRAVEPLAGHELMAARRGLRGESVSSARKRDLARGPGRLCQAMGVSLRHNGISLAGPAFRVVDDGFKPRKIGKSARIGITKAAETPWRFFIPDNPFVSAHKKGTSR